MPGVFVSGLDTNQVVKLAESKLLTTDAAEEHQVNVPSHSRPVKSHVVLPMHVFAGVPNILHPRL